MKILIAGSNGMIGCALTRYLIECGYAVSRLVRHPPEDGEVWWDPDGGGIDKTCIEGFDGVVHLASMPWPARWTSKAKQKIQLNRLASNRLLAETLAGCEHKPEVFICASGMGYYASSGDTILTEDSPCGTSFLARLQHDGEASTASASTAGIRLLNLRIAPVLGGAALKRMGFKTGDGQQWTSWVGLEELARIIEFALNTQSLVGPVNPVTPHPLRNAELAARSARALGKKPGITLPAFLIRLMMGEMGEEFMLASRRMQPAKLLAEGYQFQYPELELAIRHEMEAMV